MRQSILVFSIILLFRTTVSYGQNVGINGDGSTPNASAILDVKSTDKGMLVPRMTDAQKMAIVTPATGLLIYQTDGTPGFYYFNGTIWVGIAGSAPAWNLTGNSGTVDGTNFIGTTDDVALNFKVNNTMVGRIGNSTQQGTFFGYQAGLGGPTIGQTAFGYNALRLNSAGINNTAIGRQALELNVNGNGNTASGAGALLNSNGSRNTALGQSAGNFNTTGSDNTFLGQNANPSANNLSNATAIGRNSVVNASNKVRLGNDLVTATDVAGLLTYNAQSATTSVAFPNGRGTNGQVLTTDGLGATSWSAPAAGNDWTLLGNAGTVDGTNFIGTSDNQPLNFRLNNIKSGRIAISFTDGSTFLGFEAGLNDDLSTNQNSFFGFRAGRNNTTGNSNSAFGLEALTSNVSGLNNTAIGTSTLRNNTTGFGNNALGSGSLFNSNGNNNNAFGTNALTANTSGNENNAFGRNSLTSSTTGIENTAVGESSLNNNTTGSSNVGIGKLAGSINTVGNNNTFLGAISSASANNLTNVTAIGYGAIVNASNKVRLGNNFVTATDVAGIFTYNAQSGTTSVTLPNNRGTNGQVLTTDGAGLTSWTTVSGGSQWELTGNAGTIATTNFIGTTDNVALTFRTNNIERVRLTTQGQIETVNTGRSVFVGEGAGQNDDLTTNYNVFVGYTAGSANTSGTGNVAIGTFANRNNVLGWSNTAIGNSALLQNLTNNNTAVGEDAARNTTTGEYNTAIGRASLLLNTTGIENTTLGHGSGSVNVTGSGNTYLGQNADASANNLNNATAVGKGTIVNASNKVRLGNNLVTATDVAGVFTYNAQSGTTSVSFPNNRGTNGQVLTTDGVGGTTWTNALGESTTASNGLTLTGSNVTLGGNLTSNTTITQDNAESFTLANNGTANTVINLQNTGNFTVQDNGTDALTVTSNGQIGMGTNLPNTTLDVNGGLALRRSNFAAGAVTSLSSVELTAVVTENSFIKITGPTAAFTIHGLAGGSDGKIIHIYNATGQNMTIANASATEGTVTNRILTLTGANENTTGTGIITLIYDSAASRWIILNVRD